MPGGGGGAGWASGDNRDDGSLTYGRGGGGCLNRETGNDGVGNGCNVPGAFLTMVIGNGDVLSQP